MPLSWMAGGFLNLVVKNNNIKLQRRRIFAFERFYQDALRPCSLSKCDVVVADCGCGCGCGCVVVVVVVVVARTAFELREIVRVRK